jgi:hypothetical protein
MQQTTYNGCRKYDVLKIGGEVNGSTGLNKNRAVHE